jgi:hypothetical protein
MAGVPPPGYDYGTQHQEPPKRKKSLLPLILILGCGGAFFLCAILTAILFPVFAQAKIHAQMTACRKNMDSVGEAIEAYAREHEGRLPTTETWSKDIEPYLVKGEGLKHHCPTLEGDHGAGAGYALNVALAGKQIDKIEDARDIPILVEVDEVRQNAVWNDETSYTTNRHQNGKYYHEYYYQQGAERLEIDGPSIPVE